MCGGSKRDGTWREEAGEGALSSERHSRSICWSCASRTAASAGRESLRADCRPEKTSCRSSTRVMARARNCWCRDPARDDGPFPIAAAIGELGWKPTEWMGSWLFSFPPLARRPLFRNRDALPSFLATTLLGRGRRPWEKRRPRQKEAGDAGAQHAD
jgi:hypothetical protein